jgi:hypothetical protein
MIDMLGCTQVHKPILVLFLPVFISHPAPFHTVCIRVLHFSDNSIIHAVSLKVAVIYSLFDPLYCVIGRSPKETNFFYHDDSV